MNDPINTTAHDGAACIRCGEDATDTYAITEGSRIAIHALCDACRHDEVTDCPQCQRVIWQKDGVRIYREPDLYCRDCASLNPVMSEAGYRALLTDILKGY